MEPDFYSTAAWQRLRQQARTRDGHRCTVSRLLGGDCSGLLHAHHIDPADDPLDLDNVACVCSHHHPRWESLRRGIMQRREREWKRCPHRHRYAQGRAECEKRLNLALAE